MPSPIFLAAALALAGVNLWTLLLFRHDKACARRGDWRVREADLLWLALLGGSPAAFLARHPYRHKTRKQPFTTYLMLIAAIQLGLLAAWFIL